MLASARRHGLSLITASLCFVLVLAACRTGVPVPDTNPGSPAPMGTITGNVSGEDGKMPVAGRKVTAINTETGERFSAVTSSTGGYTLKVPPARYRMSVELAEGEAVIKDEGSFSVSRSELQHDVDIRIGTKRVGSGRIYQPPLPARAPIV
jgi:hypothetical protein